jgi:hypothetical protein
MRASETSFIISCHTCVLRHSEACDDCIVSFICNREPDDAVIIDVAEIRAIRLLTAGGLVPELRHQAASPLGDARSNAAGMAR